MNHDSTAQFGFEPSGFGGHDVASFGYAHHLIHSHRIEGKGGFHLSTVYSALEFGESTKSTHEVHTFGATKVRDA